VEAVSRLLVLVSAVVAVGLQAVLVRRGWPDLPMVLLLGVAITFVAARRWPGILHGGLAAFGYVAAGVWLLTTGQFYGSYLVVWMGALLAGMLPGATLRWSIPAPWKLPLLAWALLLAVSWPLIVLRESDFMPALLGNYRVPNTGVGVSPSEVAIGVLNVVLVQLVGILWFDWLCRTYAREDRARFERHVLLPMGGLALVSCVAALYQGFVDIQWLGGGAFPALGRAGGTMMDANAFGMAAALWAPVFLAAGFTVATRRNGPIALWLGAILLLVAAGGVWMSASRTALLALALGIAGLIGVAVRATPDPQASNRVRMLMLGAAPVLVLLTFVVLVFATSMDRGPAERIRQLVPSLSADSALRLTRLLRDRGWYGPAADLMIRDHPLVGVGVGGYYPLVEMYSRRAGRRVTFDNAQNWYRHQLAELGVVGSIPWILWMILFAGFLLRARGDGEQRVAAGVVKATLVALGVVSLLGVPTQHPAVALTFWTFVFWYVALVGSPGDSGPGRSLPRWLPWAAVWLLVFGHAVGTAYAARADLRVPYRAARGAGQISGVWQYEYGLYDVERAADLTPFRWTQDRAVAVIERRRRRLRGYQWMKLTVWASHPDTRERPLSAKVWGYGRELVIAEEQWDGSPVTGYFPVIYGHSLVETWVSRTWRPSDHGARDSRELGLALAWEFVRERPDEAARD